jgi:hypothetical protein
MKTAVRDWAEMTPLHDTSTTRSRIVSNGELQMDRDDLSERISARVSTKVRQRIEEIAAADDRPVAAVVRRLVVKALDDSDDKGVAA